MKVAVLLSGCGVYDGSEIHESVFTLLSLSQNKMEYVCFAPDINQNHTVNHLTGEDLLEKRNVLVESSRVSRGEASSLSEINLDEISALVIPGGFGTAKNLSDWTFRGVDCRVLSSVKDLIVSCVKNKKPIVSLCISPVLIAKSLEETDYFPILTIGSFKEKSEYPISEINDSLSSLGAKMEARSIREICYDEKLKIISAPCYMLDVEINEVYENIKKSIDKLKEIL